MKDENVLTVHVIEKVGLIFDAMTGWDAESPSAPKLCDNRETDGHLIPQTLEDHLSRMHIEEGQNEGAVEHARLGRKQGSEC